MKRKITEKEIKEAAKSLTMEDFFSAVKEIRVLGVLFYDEENDMYWREHVNTEALAENDPDLIDKDDSLESILYGVFESIKEWKRPKCKTCGFFRHAYHYMQKDNTWCNIYDAWKHRALVDSLQSWLRIPMQEVYVKWVESINEYDVIKRAQELDKIKPQNKKQKKGADNA